MRLRWSPPSSPAGPSPSSDGGGSAGSSSSHASQSSAAGVDPLVDLPADPPEDPPPRRTLPVSTRWVETGRGLTHPVSRDRDYQDVTAARAAATARTTVRPPPQDRVASPAQR